VFYGINTASDPECKNERGEIFAFFLLKFHFSTPDALHSGWKGADWKTACL